MATDFTLLYLAPSHNANDARPLPITLGRKSLVTWWWMACPCMGATTRTPCSECKFLGTHALALSKTMFHVNPQGILTLDSKSKNRTLVRVNGIGVFGKKQLWDGDVVTIGRYSSVSWMSLDVKTKRVVTPETRKLPTKKSIKRRRETSDRERVKESLATKRICTSGGRSAHNVRKSRAWLKMTPRQRCFLPESRHSSPVDLFQSIESVEILSVTTEKQRAREEKQVLDDTEEDAMRRPGKSHKPRMIPPNLICVKHRGLMRGSAKPERCLLRCASSSQTNTWDNDETPEPHAGGTQRQASLLEGAGCDGVPLNLPAMEHANSTSSKKVLETQATQYNNSPLCSFAEESVLSLPQCPTYDDDSSYTKGGSPLIDEQQGVGETSKGQGSDPISELCR